MESDQERGATPATRYDAGSLLVAHREGTDGAFAKLVEHYRRPVFGYLVHSGVPESDREDLFQDVFVKIHREAHRYDPTRPLHPWLFTVVANTVRSYLRKHKLRRIFFTPLQSADPKDPGPDSESKASTNEMVDWLERTIPELPANEREVFLLARLEGMSLKHIASALSIPTNTVKTRLRRARLELVERYERQRVSAS
jgi:RNA polymerase sigma-70 factor (ECF subfamily)